MFVSRDASLFDVECLDELFKLSMKKMKRNDMANVQNTTERKRNERQSMQR